jgi:N4-gp56 family major capsid protein
MAAPFKWTADVPAGVLKNSSLSKKIRREAIARCEVLPFVKTEPGFGKGEGESHTLTRILALAEPGDATLEEDTPIDEDEIDVEKVDITVTEYGRQVPFTSFARDLSTFDLENSVQAALVDQQKLVLDTLAATTFKRTPLKYVATGAASGVFEDTTATQTCASNLNVFHIGRCANRLFATQKAPKVDGDHYVGIFNSVSHEGVLDDSTFMEWTKYTQPDRMFKNEVGKVRAVRIVATNHDEALGTLESGLAGEGIVFGDDAAVMVEAVSPEIRVKIAVDFGRDPSVAWYAILGWGLPWETFALARVVHFTTAA